MSVMLTGERESSRKCLEETLGPGAPCAVPGSRQEILSPCPVYGGVPVYYFTLPSLVTLTLPLFLLEDLCVPS